MDFIKIMEMKIKILFNKKNHYMSKNIEINEK